ncbi:MAG: hypothetical protein QOJ97_1020 [Solirubrobacteraceae bacterium]|jgi:hypothetical protein|nr:hypothetical protein [Solirubrobacteraceae bacterium]
MRCAWSGYDVEAELRALDERYAAMARAYEGRVDKYERLIEDNRQFTRDCVTMMQRAANRQEEALEKVFARTDEIIAEGRAGREALFRMLDRLPPAPGTA